MIRFWFGAPPMVPPLMPPPMAPTVPPAESYRHWLPIEPRSPFRQRLPSSSVSWELPHLRFSPKYIQCNTRWIPQTNTVIRLNAQGLLAILLPATFHNSADFLSWQEKSPRLPVCIYRTIPVGVYTFWLIRIRSGPQRPQTSDCSWVRCETPWKTDNR